MSFCVRSCLRSSREGQVGEEYLQGGQEVMAVKVPEEGLVCVDVWTCTGKQNVGKQMQKSSREALEKIEKSWCGNGGGGTVG